MSSENKNYIFTPAFQRCDFCIYRTASINNLLMHVQKHHNKKLNTEHFTCDLDKLECYMCKACEFQCKLKVNLSKHINNFHKGNQTKYSTKLYECKRCKLKTQTLLVLAHHNCYAFGRQLKPKSEHTAKAMSGRFFCLKCPYRGKMRRYLRAHIQRAHDTKSNRLRCKHCTYRPLWQYELNRHILQKHINVKVKENNQDKFQCKQCPYKANSSSNLYRHVIRMHTNEEDVDWLECPQCPYRAKVKSNLQLHIVRKHTNKYRDRRFRCLECSYQVTKKRYLDDHIVDKHTDAEDLNWVKCEFCAHWAKSQSFLKRHVDIVHSNRIFLCEHCSYKTRHIRSFQKHMISLHTDPEDIKWFNCETCPYKSKIKFNLKRHVLVRHTNVAEKSAVL